MMRAPSSNCGGYLPAIDGGYKPMFAPAHPAAGSVSGIRCEKQRDFGRPMGMPLMIIRLDASSPTIRLHGLIRRTIRVPWRACNIGSAARHRALGRYRAWLTSW